MNDTTSKCHSIGCNVLPTTVDELAGDSDAPLIVVNYGEVRFVVFNRPARRNALTRAMRGEFARLIAMAEADAAAKVVIVTGAGGVFCAGVDLKEGVNEPPQPPVRPNPGEALRTLTKPVIAAVEGACVTGGLEIALSCSFVIAADDARFADTHAKVGKFPAWGLSALLPRAIGVRRARQMSLTGLFVDSGTAYEWGLVNEVTPREEFLARCVEVAAAIVGNDQRSVQAQLALLNRSEALTFDAALAAEQLALHRWRGGL